MCLYAPISSFHSSYVQSQFTFPFERTLQNIRSPTSNMFVLLQVLLLWVTLVSPFELQTQPIKGPIFKKVGTISFGKSLGHLHHSINISSLLFHHRLLKKSLRTPIDHLKSSEFPSLKQLAKLADKEVQLLSNNEDEILLALNLSPHSRSKRQLIPFLALASTGLSVYTLNELRELKQQINEDKAVIAAALQHNQEVLLEDNAHIRNLETTVNDMLMVENEVLTREKGLETVLQVFQLTSLFHQSQQRVKNILNSIRNGEIPFALFSDLYIDEGIAQLKEKLHGTGKTLMELNPSKYKVSYYVEETTLHFFIHVPLLDTKFDLYKFFSVPFSINGALMQINHHYENHFAISKGPTPMSSSLSSDFLKECDLYTLETDKFFHCWNKVNVRVPESTCLGSLFMEEPSSVNKTCGLIPFRHHEMMLNIGPHEVVVVSNDVIGGNMYCLRSDLEGAIPVPSNIIVQVPPSCTLVTANYRVSGPTSVTTNETIINIPIDLEWSTFFTFNTSSTVPEHLEVIENLKANLTALSQDHQESGRYVWLTFAVLFLIVLSQTAYLLFECFRVTKEIRKIKTLRLGGSVLSYSRRKSV